MHVASQYLKAVNEPVTLYYNYRDQFCVVNDSDNVLLSNILLTSGPSFSEPWGPGLLSRRTISGGQFGLRPWVSLFVRAVVGPGCPL